MTASQGLARLLQAHLAGAALLLVASAAPAQEGFDAALSAYDDAVASEDPSHEGFEKAYSVWSRLAEAGHAPSTYHLGMLHFYGLGGARFDQHIAVRLIRTAAENGYPMAQSFMGFLSENANNAIVRQDEEAALEWYRKGAAGDHCVSVRRLARAWREGELGLEPDGEKAARWSARREGCRKR